MDYVYYHWDLPQVLYDRYSSWIDGRIVDDLVQLRKGQASFLLFIRRQKLCFETFGDLVKLGITV